MIKLKSLFALAASAAFFFACAPANAQWQVPDNSVAIGRGTGQGFKNVPLPSGSLLIGQSGIPLAVIPTGDVTINTSGVMAIGANKITNSMILGPVPVVKGGTGAADAATARTNLGLAIGTDVQGWSANLQAFSGKIVPAGTVVGTSDTQTLINKTFNCANNACTVRLNADVTGGLQAANFPALTGDVTTSAGSLATTLATVNSNVGSFGGTAFVPFFTVNAKGLITAAGSTPYQDGTNAAKGVVRGDGTTINCVAGVCTSVGSAATSIAVNSTTIAGGTANDFLYNNGGVLASRPSGPLLQLMSRAFGGME